jgi:tetratricopeptide (TPR) repeat protein
MEEYDKSLADLDAATKIAPERLTAYVEAGITNEAADKISEALNVYSVAINMKNDLVPVEKFRSRDFLRALIRRGLAYASQDNFSSAIEDLTSLVELRKMAVEVFKEPDLSQDEIAEIWHARGRIYLDSGDHEKAILDFDEAISRNSALVKAYYYRGVAYRTASKFEAAIKDFAKAASLDSSYAEPHYALAQIYQTDIVDIHKAIQHLRTYLALGGPKKTDAEARIEELKKKLSGTDVSDEPFWEEVIEDTDGRRWIIRHYAGGKTQKFPVREEKEK